MKLAICNETWQEPGIGFDRVCERIASHGYAGVEIAPFTLAENPADLSESDAARTGETARKHGLEVVGLHWLLLKPEGLHLTTPDPAVRERTAEFACHLARLCAAMGGKVMVWGSPKQRNARPGEPWEEVAGRAAEVLRTAAECAAPLGVTIALEPLARSETNFLTSAAETVRLIRLVDHPACRLHLDVKAMSDESVPVPDLIRRYAGDTVHFHANDPNLRGPGQGAVRYEPIVGALRDSSYDGWISVEVFDYTPDADTIAEQCIRYLRSVLGTGGAGR